MVANNNTNLLNRANSFGAVYGSAKGHRNISSRLGIINKIVPLHGDRLLDIGCGNGAYTMHMASDFKSVDAIDVEPNRLKIFRQENKFDNVTIYDMSADEMNFDDETFDAITAIEVVEHVNNLANVLNEVHRVLKRGGVVCLNYTEPFLAVGTARISDRTSMVPWMDGTRIGMVSTLTQQIVKCNGFHH
ncbi:MAG: class I SAM-dependent methyltransferase [Desulfobacula sp.]|jgi:ubiquinone/menaquinone biosynthesis C-methylase UbiE|nr:class I SAM-dependent methyltransferase [Desulfobacula sp.]